MKNRSIFIALAPNHISSFEKIIQSKLDFGETILLNPGNFTFTKKLWSKVIDHTFDLRYRKASFFSKILYQLRKTYNYKNYYNNVTQNISHNQKYDFYYCNLDDIITNLLFNDFNSKNLIRRNYIVEDGILNYYFPKIDTKKLLFKKLLCNYLFQIKFVPEKKHSTGIYSSIVHKQFVRSPKHSIFPEKSIELPYDEINYIPNKNSILIIGQDIMQNVKGQKYYESRLLVLFNYIKKKYPNCNVIYKPHRNGNQQIAKKLLKEIFINFNFYQEITPVEECIVKIKPEQIFSFYSSALFNIRIAYKNENVNIYALPFGNEDKRIMDFFNSNGIIIL